jgi:Arc/MetJ-type ribon-helix-helix transcriptional regulator
MYIICKSEMEAIGVTGAPECEEPSGNGMMESNRREMDGSLLPMTIQLTPEDERLIQERLRTGAFQTAQEVIHCALVSLEPPKMPFDRARKNLADVLCSSPFAGSELNLERQKDDPRPLEL